jgi:hypothetical protein
MKDRRRPSRLAAVAAAAVAAVTVAATPPASAESPGGGARALAGAAFPGASVVPSAGARGAAAAGAWGKAREMPGTAALNQGGRAGIDSVSCGSPGNCSAGGYYTDSSGAGEAFVASEAHGTWGTAQEVPGSAALNSGGGAQLTAVSCVSAGNCSAGGGYIDSSGNPQVFVARQVDGTWSTAEEVPGTATLNQGGLAVLTSVSCGSAGNCSAGGQYADSSYNRQAFVVDEVDGTWVTAQEVPGAAALNHGDAELTAVSCGSAGNCSAGGYYEDSSGQLRAFVDSEVDGTWGSAREVPGTAALSHGGYAEVTSVSCTSAGNCGIGGQYARESRYSRVFVASEVNGSWSSAEEVPGAVAVNQGDARHTWISCASAGNCSVGGDYTDGSGHLQAFVASEVNGSWGSAQEVPGTAALNQGGHAEVTSVSCASAGNCSAGGQYTDGSGHLQAFVASEVNGSWGSAEDVPGAAALNQGGHAEVTSVSCASAGNCSAGGQYSHGPRHLQVFVVSETQPASVRRR